MKIMLSHGYEVAGNEYIAIAINETITWDVKYFYPKLSMGYDAFQQAIKWTENSEVIDE